MRSGNAVAKKATGATLALVVKDAWVPERLKRFVPRSQLGEYILECVQYLPVHMAQELIDRVSKTVVVETSLALKHFRGAQWSGLLWDVSEARLIEDCGVVGTRLVTTAGVTFLANTFVDATSPIASSFKYHALGTVSTTETIGEAALGLELTTEYSADNNRVAGTASKNGVNIYRSVGTVTVDLPAAVKEHGIFSTVSSGTGVLWDRTAFAVVNLAANDSLQSTYDLTIAAGG